MARVIRGWSPAGPDVTVVAARTATAVRWRAVERSTVRLVEHRGWAGPTVALIAGLDAVADPQLEAVWDG